MTTNILGPHDHVRAPDLPTAPLGGSRSELFYLAIGVVAMAFIALAFWFQATH